MTDLKVGDVLWRMKGRQKTADTTVEWHAVPVCVEYVDGRKFLDAWSCGGSLNLIGVTYFRTREECLEDHNRHKYRDYLPPEPPPKTKLGDPVPDSREICRSGKYVFIYFGIGRNKVPDGCIPWTVEGNGEDEFIYTTLGAIREAVKAKLKTDFVTVVVEDGLHGEIYETGNYPGETQFRLHGETLGYW